MTPLSQTTSLCAHCKRQLDASIFEREGAVWMHKRCPQHGEETVCVATNAAWYRRVMSLPMALDAPAAHTPSQRGCPLDCGACDDHLQRVHLPVVPITSACNQACPICYTLNRSQQPYHIALDDFRATLAQIVAADPQRAIINLTGGEPTQHPRLIEILEACAEVGLHRVTLSTHGLEFLKNPALLERLAALHTRVVLSFDAFDDAVNQRMVGANITAAKLALLDRFDALEMDVTLIPVIARGVNDDQLGAMFELLKARPSLRSLEIHTMTFAGAGGANFDLSARIGPFDVMAALEAQTGGALRVSDFAPSPLAHPLCYQTCYLLDLGGGELLPFARFLSAASLRSLLGRSLYLEPTEHTERVLLDAIDQLWASPLPDGLSERVLVALKALIRTLFPTRALPYAERQRLSERAVKTVYLHAHMDAHDFDSERVRRCCVAVPEADGSAIPTCAYNVIYRQRDPRFNVVPDARPLEEMCRQGEPCASS